MHMLVPSILVLLLAVAPCARAGDDDLLAVDARWNALRLAADVAGLHALLDDAFVLTHSDGRVEYKRGYLDALRTSTRVNHAIENADVDVRRHGDTAIVTGRSLQRGVGASGPFSGEFRFTRVWVRDAGGWRLVASHSSRLADPPGR